MVPGAQGAHGKHGALGAQESQIRITDVQAYYNRVGGNRGPVGDVEIIKQRLYNVRISQAPIGRADVTCMFLDRSERTCNATYFLPKGNLVVAGERLPAPGQRARLGAPRRPPLRRQHPRAHQIGRAHV